MSDFPEGIAAPEGAQKLVGVCKETWTVIQDGSSEASEHDEALESFEAAMDELAELGVHVNNEGEYPVFSLGVKETVYGPLKLPKAVALSALTTALLEFPLLEPPLSSKCNCMEWAGLKDDFDADFRRLGQADLNRMELSQVGGKAVAHGDAVGMTAANGVYTSSFHSLKGSYQELLLQKEKAKKRASAGGSVAGGDAAASCLVFEYCDLLFKAFREQWSCFKEQRKEAVLLSLGSRTSAGAGTESEGGKSDKAKRKKMSGAPSRRRPMRRSGTTRWPSAGRLESSLLGTKRTAP
jgi:hypothetical protein